MFSPDGREEATSSSTPDVCVSPDYCAQDGGEGTGTGVFFRGGSVLYGKVGKELCVSVSDTVVLFFLRWWLNVCVFVCVCEEN